MEFMSEIIISTLEEHPDRLEEVMDIFFESSTKKDFASVEERTRFVVKYLGVYLQSYPQLSLIALKENKVLGYCCGMPHTPPELYELQPHLEVFEDQFDLYESHLHINCHHEARGMGVGAKLVGHFEALMRQEGVQGIHIITSPQARNISFYERLGYHHRVQRDYNDAQLLFLGKTL
jgi:ribosomal protein S18 acetylase RimI-like enzyme